MMGSQLYAGILEHALAEYRGRGPLHAFFERDGESATLSTPAIRLMGALHYLALTGEAPELAKHLPSCGGDRDARAAWRAGSALLETRADRIAELYAQTPQTNEVARAIVLLGGLCVLARAYRLPVRLFEIGASAGLITRLDRYFYSGTDWHWGDASSPLRLHGDVKSGRPRLEALTIVERAACDLHPLDIGNAEHRIRLLSFVWADQLDRIERLRAAFEAAARLAFVVEEADMFAWLRERVSPKAGTATVVMHSLTAEHLSREQRAELVAAIAQIGERASADAPVAWLRLELNYASKGYETTLTTWPGAREQLIARSTAHAQGIEWAA